MRISGPTANAAIATPGAKRATSGNFSLNEGSQARAPGAPAAVRSVGGIDALIALQGLDDPAERRKQALRRGRHALDALDELKVGLLGGTLSQATLGKLKAVAGALKELSGDDRLDAVLGEIELRVEVEIAKMAPR